MEPTPRKGAAKVVAEAAHARELASKTVPDVADVCELFERGERQGLVDFPAGVTRDAAAQDLVDKAQLYRARSAQYAASESFAQAYAALGGQEEDGLDYLDSLFVGVNGQRPREQPAEPAEIEQLGNLRDWLAELEAEPAEPTRKRAASSRASPSFADSDELRDRRQSVQITAPGGESMLAEWLGPHVPNNPHRREEGPNSLDYQVRQRGIRTGHRGAHFGRAGGRPCTRLYAGRRRQGVINF